MLKTKNSKIYVATFGVGLKHISSDLRYIESENIDNPYFNIRTAKINTIYEDKHQNLWLGCYQNGLLMFSDEVSPFKQWKVYPETKAVQSVFWDRDGNLLSAIEKNGIVKMDSTGNITEHWLEGKDFSSVFQDNAGNLWFGGRYSGLFAKNAETGKITELFVDDRYKFNYNNFREDADGNMYISLFGRGFIRYNPTTQEIKKFVNIQNDKNSVSTDWIYSIVIDNEGLVWLGSVNGLECYNPKTEIFTRFSLPGITKYIVHSLLNDGEGNIWTGTNQGLAHFNTKTNTTELFQEKDGLSCNVVYALAKDAHGNIWCSTLKGISKLQITDKKFYFYNTGLTSNGYAINSASNSPDGTVFFGGTNGITVFHPDSVSATNTPAKIALSAIYLNGKPVNANTLSGNNPVITGKNNIRLSFLDNTFTLEFTTFTFDDPSNTFYEYRFRDREESWNITRPGINQITYNHLPHGNYILDVRACSKGVYSEILPVAVHILPPWWQSWWAYLIYIALATLVLSQIYFAVKRRHSQEMNEGKIKLFVNLSHEIRSPMTLIINPLDAMLKKDYDEETLRMLRMMKKNANRIIGLINQLLDMRKIEKGRMRIKCSKVDLIPYIKGIIDLYEYQANKRNIRLCLDAAMETIPAWIDTNNFDKVLVNIITNALKYTSDGGIIKILLQERTDKSFIGDLHRYIEIQVLDTGKGIDADKLEKIFERFYTTPADEAMGGVGFGIGLNLCRLIVKLHHGTITAHNRKDTQGSCFTIRIPYGNMHLKKDEISENIGTDAINRASAEIAGDEQTVPKSKRSQSGTDKILVVDDDEDILAYLSAELSGAYKIRTCNNGNDAWHIILAEKPQLVISDVVMPGMDGYTLLKQVKKNVLLNHIPFILLTSKTESEERIKGIKFGADAYLNKPFNIDELKASVANLLENARRLKGKYSGAAEQESGVEKIELKVKNDELMERIMKVINKNIANPNLDVSFLAREAGISRVHLHRKLKEMTGVPVASFIRNIRLQQAALLLRNKQQDVAQVGYAVGYENQANFATVFKKQFGVAPSKYAESFTNYEL
jgi:signal transduction histidine kinase/DNA-binding response OmpR family regulator/ligand-binding sensor domain-containing protein